MCEVKNYKIINMEDIKDAAREAADRSQFISSHKYDHKSYEDGFIEGANYILENESGSSRCRDTYDTDFKRCPFCLNTVSRILISCNHCGAHLMPN